jgi:hypothetical protein
MSYYYPSETFDEKFVIETKNKWLKNPVLDALNEATEIVLESSKSSFPQLNFSSTCFEELNKSRQIEKKQGFPLRYLKVDNILGGDFQQILLQFIEIVNDCMYDTSCLLYGVHTFLDHFETSREYHEDKELKHRKEIGIIKGRRILRELIEEKVSEVVEDHSDKKDFLIRKIELSEIIERHFYHILINLTKLSFANTLKDYSTCVQELLVLISAIMNVSLKEKKVLSLNSVGED